MASRGRTPVLDGARRPRDAVLAQSSRRGGRLSCRVMVGLLRAAVRAGGRGRLLGLVDPDGGGKGGEPWHAVDEALRVLGVSSLEHQGALVEDALGATMVDVARGLAAASSTSRAARRSARVGERTRPSARRFVGTRRGRPGRRRRSRCLQDQEVVCASAKRRAASSPTRLAAAAIMGALRRSDTSTMMSHTTGPRRRRRTRAMTSKRRITSTTGRTWSRSDG